MIKKYLRGFTYCYKLSKRDRKKKIRVYEINKELLVDLLTLTKLKNPYLKNCNTVIVKN